LPKIETNDEEEDRGGVVLRREQVRLVLFEGKFGATEDITHSGMVTSAFVLLF
jgi:hypothetical protein